MIGRLLAPLCAMFMLAWIYQAVAMHQLELMLYGLCNGILLSLGALMALMYWDHLRFARHRSKRTL